MTLNEYAYDLYELLRANLTDNEHEDIRQIKFWLKNQRSFWASNEIDKQMKFLSSDSPFLQELDNITVSITDLGEKAGFTSGKKILRTEPLPDITSFHGGLAIEGVYPQCLVSGKLTLVPWDRFVNTGNLRFNSKAIYASYNHGRIYFKQSANLENYRLLNKVKISAIFEDPEELKEYINSDGNPAYSDNDSFPISGKFYENIKKSIINNNFELILNGRDSETQSAAV